MADPAMQQQHGTDPVTAARQTTPAAPARGGFISTSCLALLLAAPLFVVLAGVVIGSIGSWFDVNPFGLFAEPETQIHDR